MGAPEEEASSEGDGEETADSNDEFGDASAADDGDSDSSSSSSKRQKRKRHKTPEDSRLRALKKQLDRRAIAGSVFADADGLEDLLD